MSIEDKINTLLENQARMSKVLSALLQGPGISADFKKDGSSLHSEMLAVRQAAEFALGRSVPRK